MTDFQHIPVMLREVLETLAPDDNEVYLDGTFGRGGYSRAILEAADCSLFAIDRDPQAIERGKALSKDFAGRLTMLPGCFGDMEALMEQAGISGLNGIVLDIGVSSPQLDDPERGFSFREDGPLDMRMGGEGPTAADIVNSWEPPELAKIIREFGEERFAKKVANAIVKARTDAPITRTQQLADIVRSVVRASKDGIDPATRTFQGLRIAVNDELGELDRALTAAERLLAPGGRLVVVSFHSLEDRRVKTFLHKRSGRGGGGSRHRPLSPTEMQPPSFKLITRKALTPQDDETRTNPRARSAKLRAATRTDAPVWLEGDAL